MSFRLTDLLLLAVLTFAGFHFLIEPMRAASGLSADDWHRSGRQVTAICALGVILATRVGLFAGFALARLFGGKGGASLCAALGCVLCAWSLLYGAGSKGVHVCFSKGELSDLELVDWAFQNAAGDPGTATPVSGYVFSPIPSPASADEPDNGWIHPE